MANMENWSETVVTKFEKGTLPFVPLTLAGEQGVMESSMQVRR